MLSLKYARCSPILQFRKCYSTKNCKWQLLLQIRPTSRESLCKVKQVQLVTVRHFFRRTTGEGVTFKSAHSEDGISRSFKLIFYNGTSKYYVYGAKVIYVLLGFIASISVATLYKLSTYDLETVSRMGRSSLGTYEVSKPAPFCYLALIFVAMSLTGTVMISRNVPLRIYRDNTTKQYAGRFLRFGLYKETIKFTHQDISLMEKHSMWSGNVSICGRKSMVSEQNFKTVGDYNQFMGYDYGRASDVKKQAEAEDVAEMMKSGLRMHQENQYRSFEKQYIEKRKLRNMK